MRGTDGTLCTGGRRGECTDSPFRNRFAAGDAAPERASCDPGKCGIDGRQLFATTRIECIQGFVILALHGLLGEVGIKRGRLAASVALNRFEPFLPGFLLLAQGNAHLCDDLLVKLYVHLRTSRTAQEKSKPRTNSGNDFADQGGFKGFVVRRSASSMARRLNWKRGYATWTMMALRLERLRSPLVPRELTPEPLEAGELRVQVEACAVCRTDLHLIDGDVAVPHLPITPGHEVIGIVTETRAPDVPIRVGDRVGIPWLAQTCGVCRYCQSGRENLCGKARFTGCHVDGGFAEYAKANARYVLPIPGELDAAHAAPLLCAGLIGYRSYRMAGDPERLGLYGFGAAAHIVAQLAVAEGRKVFAFTRPGDRDGQAFARELGATWAGGSGDAPPEPLDSAILFAPVGALVPRALAAVERGGRVVCAGIHMSEIPAFPYELLWGERRLLSVANLTREDGFEFLDTVAKHPVQTRVTTFSLRDANQAVTAIREGALRGAAVLIPSDTENHRELPQRPTQDGRMP